MVVIVALLLFCPRREVWKAFLERERVARCFSEAFEGMCGERCLSIVFLCDVSHRKKTTLGAGASQFWYVRGWWSGGCGSRARRIPGTARGWRDASSRRLKAYVGRGACQSFSFLKLDATLDAEKTMLRTGARQFIAFVVVPAPQKALFAAGSRFWVYVLVPPARRS